MSLALDHIRRQAIVRSLFCAATTGEAIDRLGFVQADPLARPARAQDMILRQRVTDYRVGDLERQYPSLGLEEDLIHVYGYMPHRTMTLLHPRTGKEWRVEREHPDLGARVLEFVQANGPVDHRGLEEHFGAITTIGNWGSAAKATTRVLEMLHYRGHLRVAGRKGNVRIYEAGAPVETDLEPAERLRRLVLLQARLYAPMPVSSLKMIVRHLRWSAPSLPGVMTAVNDLMKAGELEQAKVGKVTYVWPAGEWAPEGDVPRVVRLLAPFDPLVWDRARFEQLWGWPYRFEAYTPAAKRQFGHYPLPLMWGEQFIGWANVSYKKGQLDAELGFVDGRPADPEFERELEAELERMRLFLGGR